MAWMQAFFQTVAMAQVSASARDAQVKGLLRADDVVVMNTHEVLHVAKAQAISMYESGYRPPNPAVLTRVLGAPGIATLKTMLINMLEGHFISDHDFEVGARIASCLCGGEVDEGSFVDDQWLLRLERESFAALAATEKTQARIMHTLKTGKPLRN